MVVLRKVRDAYSLQEGKFWLFRRNLNTLRKRNFDKEKCGNLVNWTELLNRS